MEAKKRLSQSVEGYMRDLQGLDRQQAIYALEKRTMQPLWVATPSMFKTHQTSKAFSTSTVGFLPVFIDPQHFPGFFLSGPKL